MSSRMVLSLAHAALVAGLLLGAGCGGNDDGRPRRYPLTGVVTLGGEPVEGATVMFVAVDGKGGAAGRTDAQGRYAATTFNPGDGAVPGEYLVTVSKYEMPSEFPDEAEDSPGQDQEHLPPPTNLVPAKYADVQTSGLTVSVVEGKNSFDIALE